jgi:HSP20 family molecular chaperone IbpA
MEVQPSKHLSSKYLIIKGFKEVRGSKKNVSERFLMPENSDPSKISAELKDGLLTVKVEKLEDSKPLQVKIN